MNFYHSIVGIRSIFIVFVIFAIGSPVKADSEVVNVYSARKESLILPLLKKFETETGIKVNLITAKADAITQAN